MLNHAMKCIAGISKICLTNHNLGYAYTNGIVVLAEGLDMFRLGPIAFGGRMIPSGNLFFTKRTLLDGCLGAEPRRDGITSAEGPCEFRGNHFD
jgi:hypothetical protein